jgi:tetratricopeptide (TPR) repeat protein
MPSPMASCPRLTVILLLVFAVPAYLPAQSSATPSASNKSESETKPDFSQQPAIYEYLHASMRYENDGSGTREVHARIRVQTQAGLNVAGQLVFNYNAIDEQMEVPSVRVLKKEGAIVTAGPEAIQDLSAPVTQEAPMYTDARQKHVTVPGVSVGDVVEYDVTIKAKPLQPGQFWHIWYFAQGFIALDEQLDLNVPKGRLLKIKSPEGIQPSISIEGDRRLYHWATSNSKTSPPVDFFKNFQFDVIKLLEGYRPSLPPHVMFSTFQNWTDVAEWYAQLERERRILTPEIRAKADEIARGQQTAEAKAQVLYYWVSQNIRYVSLSFGVGRYQPHAAAEVLANRYGDCKDKTTLLEAMLDAEGLHAYPALVNSKADVDPEIPNPMQFDHAIAFVRIGNKDVWLDSTVGVSPFGYLLPHLRNGEALVISETSSAGLRKMPQEFPFTIENRVGVEGTIDGQGMLDAKVEVQTRGDLEVLIRVLNERISREQLAKSADSVLAQTNGILYGSVRYTDFKVANPSDISQPVKAQFRVNGKLMTVNPNSDPSHLTGAIGALAMSQLRLLAHLPAIDAKTDTNSKAQQLPVDLKGPRWYSLNLNLTFTDLPRSDPPPAREFHLAQEFADFQSRDSWEGNTLHGFKSLDLRVPTIPSVASSEYVAFVKKITEAMAAPPEPKIEAKTAPAPAKAQPVEDKHLPTSEAQDMFKRGEDEYKRKNWANAIEAFASAVKADPQYPDAWRELGRARMYARQYSDAESAFRKYLELAPNDSRAYLNIAWVLFNERKFEEERDLMLKRIAVAPDDGDALFRLGTAYLALHLPAQSVPMLERSVVQFPKYVDAHIALGRAYLENHQDLLAQVSFRKALALDDSDNRLNTAAYLLAEHKSFLDLAESWSQRSIDVVEKELNNSTLPNVQSATWTLVARLAHYWDTMGWIKFQQSNMDAAEKYLHAAWQITDELIVGFHLGRIYEAQGRQNEAAEMYLAALSKVPPNGTLGDDAKETRKRLADILGGDSQVDARLEQSRKKKSPLGMVSIANPGGEQGIAQYTVMIDANSKVVELSAVNSDDPLASLSDAVRAARMPQVFPDITLKKLPRLSTLACSGSDQPCTFTLLPALAASRLTPLD